MSDQPGQEPTQRDAELAREWNKGYEAGRRYEAERALSEGETRCPPLPPEARTGDGKR